MRLTPPAAPDVLEPNASNRPGKRPDQTAWRPGFGLMATARFVLVYFVSFFAVTQLWLVPVAGDWLGAVEVGFRRSIVPWIGVHVFRLPRALTIPGNGFSDSTSDYVEIASLAIVAAIAAIVWTRHTTDVRRFAREVAWGRAILRYSVAIVLFSYGAIKVIPGGQFGAPEPSDLMFPMGNLAPATLLWVFMGFSPLYQVFCGVGEMTAAFLVCSRRAATLGAMLSLVIMANVVMMNIAYNVSVKLFAVHVALMALAILIPDVPRLWQSLIRNHPVPAVPIHDLAMSIRVNRAMTGLKVLAVGFLAVANIHHALQTPELYPAQPLSGAWEVERFTHNSREIPPTRLEAERWKRVAINAAPRTIVQLESDSLIAYRSARGDDSRR